MSPVGFNVRISCESDIRLSIQKDADLMNKEKIWVLTQTSSLGVILFTYTHTPWTDFDPFSL